MIKHVRLIFIGMIGLFASCQSGTSTETAKTTPSDVHKLVVDNVMQASAYTYLHGKENGADQWVAVPSMTAKSGETYYYKGGLQMKKFESKELNKVFESIILLDRVSAEPDKLGEEKPSQAAAPADAAYGATSAPADAGAEKPAGAKDDGAQYTRTSTPPEKKEVKVSPAKGGITIAELFAKKEAYAGKTVRIKGEVTKFTPAVMNKNWIHIQDGTESNGKFDLAVTSDVETKVGETVTLEGKISLNKDLGYGYFFEVIMEDAVTK